LEKRLEAHNLGKGAKYTRSRKPVELLESSSEMTKSDALKLERHIKRMPAGRKRFELGNETAHLAIGDTQILEDFQKELQLIIESIRHLTESVRDIVSALKGS
jgi:putative endonuclease